MWWRSPAIVAALCAGAAALIGCGFQPMYGGSTVGGTSVVQAMASVDVNPIPGRVGQRVRNELIFASTGGGYATQPRYRLDIAIKEHVTSQLVQISGEATGDLLQRTCAV
jgi:LPS-assembly lipoprotein